MNSVIITGNLTKEPMYKEGNMKVASFTIAWNKGEKASFFDCIAFDKKAELVNLYCKKGNKVLIRGELSQDKWQAQDGSTRTAVRIIVNEIEFLSKREDAPEEKEEPVEIETAQAGELPF